MTDIKSLKIGPKTIEEWELDWVEVPDGLKEHQSTLSEVVGLFLVTENGQPRYIGKGAGKKGGIAKRLSDHFRPSSSGRNYRAGALIYENRSRLKVYVLITSSYPNARKIARDLRSPMIRLHRPTWNKRW